MKVPSHNTAAPYWAPVLFGLVVIGLATNWVDGGPFWTGYVLDMTGPAWNYILFRRLSHPFADNRWTRIFTPLPTFLLIAGACFAIETLQYFEVYDATYDPWDLLAYVSILFPLFILDLWLNHRRSQNES